MQCLVTNVTSYEILIEQETLSRPSFTIDNWHEHAYYRIDWKINDANLGYIFMDLHANHAPHVHHCLLKEVNTLSYNLVNHMNIWKSMRRRLMVSKQLQA